MNARDAELFRLQGIEHPSYGSQKLAKPPPAVQTSDDLVNDAELSDKEAGTCCSRPYLVEVPMFLYFLAYKACLPLQVNSFIN